MSRVTALYKLKEGLGSYVREKIVDNMKTSYFLMNVDECMSNANEKVFSIMVSYFSESEKCVIVEHYDSKSLIVVNAQKLLEHVTTMLLKDEIPFENVVSNLLDSTNYMRGKVAGFETLLRKEMPHLLNIDGDTCHHTHNTVKKFLSPFKKYIEHLCDDLHTDFQWSADQRQYLAEIREFIGINYRMPAARVDHRWLSSYNAVEIDISLPSAFTVFYFTWLSKEDVCIYKDVIDKILEVKR